MSIISELVSIAGTALGAWGVFLALQSNKKNRKLKSVTWSDIQSATKFFWKELKHKQFEPTFIITPGQKGGIIAKIIGEYFEEIIPIYSGYTVKKDTKQFNDENYFKLSTTKWHVHIPISVKTFEQKNNVKVLIVDDFVMSGDFLSALKKALLEFGYLEENICSCAVAVTKVAVDADKAPTYHWKVVDDKEFYFPWGKAE